MRNMKRKMEITGIKTHFLVVVLSTITILSRALKKSDGITLLHKNLKLFFFFLGKSSSFPGCGERTETLDAQQNKKTNQGEWFCILKAQAFKDNHDLRC